MNSRRKYGDSEDREDYSDRDLCIEDDEEEETAANITIVRISRCKRRVVSLVRNPIPNLNAMIPKRIRTVIMFLMKVGKIVTSLAMGPVDPLFELDPLFQY